MAEHIFKTIYFPREKVRAGKSARVTVSLPASPTDDGTDNSLVRYFQGISSREFRAALGNPYLEDLEERAIKEGRSLSNICFRILSDQYRLESRDSATNGRNGSQQLSLPLDLRAEEPIIANSVAEPKADLGVTFRDSLRQGAYGWYPYVEGFSATYTRDAILRYSPQTILDPFGGAGTTLLAAASLGIASSYCEVNPFMAFVTDTKVNSARWARRHLRKFEHLADAYLAELTGHNLDELGANIDVSEHEKAFPGRDFFVERDLRHLLAAKELAISIAGNAKHARALFLLACAANAVKSSNMTRRADLRRRRSDEYKTRVVNVSEFIGNSVRRMVDDIRSIPINLAPTTKIGDDCRNIASSYKSAFEMALTSPPYLNGTNYFRNTKIELWLLGFIDSEDGLSRFRKEAICAGINNVSRDRGEFTKFDTVEMVGQKLDDCAKDRRIPLLVRTYFSDMQQAFASVFNSLAPNGVFLLDIGDSKFYGVHVPTDRLLTEVAKTVGFSVEHRHLLARRHSRDKSELVQIELVLRKPPAQRHAATKSTRTKSDKSRPGLNVLIKRFQDELPYKQVPFSQRNWGHPLHSLCSYQGKLKPALAHWIVRVFLPTGARILDPLGGVGTIAFEGAVSGHPTISNDKSPFPAIIAAAKLDPPSHDEASEALSAIESHMREVVLSEEDWSASKFGLNGTVADYYHERTLEEILKARRVFAERCPPSRGENFVWASLLHVLHGNRPYALSRTSHPITPFHPKGAPVYKKVVEKVQARIDRALSTELPAEFVRGVGLQGDFRELVDKQIGTFHAIITSPPFLGMRFDRPNWLRLWFCGWNEKSFHKTSLGFLEREQIKSRKCYDDFFEVSRSLIEQSGILIIHLGSGGKGDLVGDLKHQSRGWFELVGEVQENVQAVEQHGIRDKGRTTDHHILVFRPSC